MYDGNKELEVELSEVREQKYGSETFEWKYEAALELGLQKGLSLIK